MQSKSPKLRFDVLWRDWEEPNIEEAIERKTDQALKVTPKPKNTQSQNQIPNSQPKTNTPKTQNITSWPTWPNDQNNTSNNTFFEPLPNHMANYHNSIPLEKHNQENLNLNTQITHVSLTQELKDNPLFTQTSTANSHYLKDY